jgi:hypothetical protein
VLRLQAVKKARPLEVSSDVLLITGDGSQLQGDMDEFLELYRRCDLMCIGRSIQYVGFAVQHYVDVDADAGKWVAENLYRNNPLAGKPIRHTLGEVDWFDWGWDTDDVIFPMAEAMWFGSSAFFGVLIGIEMGYRRIALAGCPMDRNGHWYHPENINTPSWRYQDLAVWLEFAGNGYADNVRSMSGYTATILGRPTKQWVTLTP